MMNKLILLMSIQLGALSAQAQVVLKGTVMDRETKETLPVATLCLTSESKDSVFTSSDYDGMFTFTNLKTGNYIIRVNYMGFDTYEKKLALTENKTYEIEVEMNEEVQKLEYVSVEARAVRAQQKGDSLIYNADAFKVLEGSNVEDLLSKMPGVVVEGGTVQAQGEEVKKVLVDGKEFFDGDVNLALKNLPADIIASIEVFDKKSEQAEFTGFDDGEEIKTINIVTKTGFKEGTFGEVYGGYGLDNRYRAGGNVNIFDEDQRISILGMSNNVNQQNFSQEDLAGVMSSQSRSGGRKKGGGGGRGAAGGGGTGTVNSSNFMVGALGGVTSSNGLGLNYVNQWDERLKLTSSYFMNQSSNDYVQDLERNYLDAALPGWVYKEHSDQDMTNWNHRVNMNLDYQINDRSSFQIKPSFSFQNNETTGSYSGENLANDVLQNLIINQSDNFSKAYKVGADAVYRHRFNTPGRTLSLSLKGQLSHTAGDAYATYLESYWDADQKTEDQYGQWRNTLEEQKLFRGNLMFTEKLMDQLQLQANYKFSYTNTDSDRKTYAQDGETDLYEQLEEDLSNTYQSDYLTHAGGLGLRWNKGNLRTMLGVDMQWASLMGEQTYPFVEDLSHDYLSVLPSFTARYMLDRTNSFQFRYRSSSMAPSIRELQEVVDNTNPLFLYSGNPDLDQQINHTLNLRYLRTTLSGHTFIAMVGSTLRADYVGDSTFVADRNMEVGNGVMLNKGAQFTKPVNLSGYYSLQSMLTYGLPVDWLRSNVNMSFSANYAHVPTIFNGVSTQTQELTLIPKLVVGSNISKDLDFTLSYAASVNKTFSSMANELNSNYVTHSAAAKLGWMFWNGFTFRTTFNYIGYSGLEAETSDYFLWNVSLGKKFLKNNAAEIRIEAFDLLQQNQAFSQTVGSNYYDYRTTNVLQPYAMLSFTYTIR